MVKCVYGRVLLAAVRHPRTAQEEDGDRAECGMPIAECGMRRPMPPASGLQPPVSGLQIPACHQSAILNPHSAIECVANGRSEEEIRKMTARMVDPEKEDEEKQ